MGKRGPTMYVELPEQTITAIIAKLETIQHFTNHRDATHLLEQILDAYLYANHHQPT